MNDNDWHAITSMNDMPPSVFSSKETAIDHAIARAKQNPETTIHVYKLDLICGYRLAVEPIMVDAKPAGFGSLQPVER